MAAMAASLMCCGVAKWGSPAPKSTSFAPCARSLAASAVTAMVAEISIRPIRSEKSAVAVVVMEIFFQIFEGDGGEILSCWVRATEFPWSRCDRWGGRGGRHGGRQRLRADRFPDGGAGRLR